ncbi:MAG: family 20 glycosylhydrolase [Victivallales bacterium]|nr:family 20 glycosylhydrolase [Victivallales bacterium]
MKHSTLDILIPLPKDVILAEGHIALRSLDTLFAVEAGRGAAEEIHRGFEWLRLPVRDVASQADAKICLELQADMGKEEWRLQVTMEKITIASGSSVGLRYAANALSQMAFYASQCGTENAYLDCGMVKDAPRFDYRGFMLDSVRHFQKPQTICKFLRLLAVNRINKFHWHLTDNQGWRLPSTLAAKVSGHGTAEDGCYSREDLKEIVKQASELGIQIIPEIDVPGHSKLLITAYPEYSCEHKPTYEFCIGNPKSLEFIKGLYDELMELFPESEEIHLGGDEAVTDGWEKCPLCQKAMKDKGLKTMRELESDFMSELCRHIASKGRRPRIWGSCNGQVYSPDIMLQAWLDIREPLRIAPHGNKVVYSVHTSLYLDYPANAFEPQENWMFALPEEGVYMTDPYVIWENKVKDTIIGPETCLWTEQVPEWRIFQKVMSRIAAYSEVAWTNPAQKDYHDFCIRKATLATAGWNDYIASN